MIRAILIDDEKWSRNVIRNFGKWTELGIEIVGEAEDGESGLQLVEHFSPEIIITDMHMPNLDGIALLQKLQNEATTAKIIIISGYDDYAYMKQAIQSKAFEYLLKPIDEKELNRVLQACVESICLEGSTNAHIFYDTLPKEMHAIIMKNRRQISLCLDNKDVLKVKKSLKQLEEELDEYLSSNQSATIKKQDTKIIVSVLSDYLNNLLQEKIIAEVHFDPKIMQSYKKLIRHVEKGCHLKIYIEQLEAFIESAFMAYLQYLAAENQSVVIQAKDYIDEHFRESITLERIAKRFFTSKAYLSGAFKSKYDINISQYVLDLKMAEAIRLLKDGEAHSKVGKALGYKDLNYFYKVFKKYHGCTPGEYWEDKKNEKT